MSRSRRSARRGLIAVSATLVLLVTWRTVAQRRAEVEFWWRALTGTASFLAEFVDRWAVERAADARTLALLPILCRSGDADRSGRVLDSAVTTALPAGNRAFAWIVDPNGRVVSRTSPLDPTAAEVTAALARRHEERGLVTDLSADVLQVSFFAPVATPPWRCGMSAGNNEDDGLVLILRTHVDPVIVLLARSTLRSSLTARTVVVARDGDTVRAVITSSARDSTGPRLFGVRSAFSTASAHLRAAAMGLDTTVTGVDFAGRKVMAAVQAAGTTGWGIVRQMDEAEAYQRARRQTAIELSLAATVIGAFWLVLIAHERAARIRRLRGRLLRVQLQTLKAQLRPHFLFNALNAIVELITRDPEKAESMLLRLSHLLRVSLHSRGQEVELRSEVEMVAAYAELEQLRFRDRLRVDLDIPPELLGALVPALVLQPLVENGIRHGVARTERGGGLVRVSASASGARLTLTVEDNGAGLDAPSPMRGLGVGLTNTRRRLRRLYGPQHEFRLANRPDGGARATVVLPLRFTNEPARTGRTTRQANRRARRAPEAAG